MTQSNKNKKASHFCEALSEPWRIRTSDRLLRREVLYPAELRARSFIVATYNCVGVAGFEPATSSSQTRRDDRATLHPEKANFTL
jgi:hypothetical protein